MELDGLEKGHDLTLCIGVRFDVTLRGPEICVAGQDLNISSDPITETSLNDVLLAVLS
jgi:hypothetical protein